VSYTDRRNWPNKTRTGTYTLRRIPSAVILAFLLILAACQTESGIAKSILDEDPEFRISAIQLAAEYESSESAANEK